ncbi:MAG: phenylacetate--CoA ligase, partial [Solirubrobacterales bacterium]|nr:phenylacetate--CoA ligase [Solirubrobacterales bacterium]
MARVIAGQPLGAERLGQAGVASVRDVRSLEDLAKIPFATKQDLHENYPFGLLAVPREEIVRVHASSGTHGKPTVVGYTRADLETWTDLMARCMTMAGVRPGMLIHNANGYGLFTGGLGFHQGGERIGATVVPVSSGMTARQAMLLRDFGAQVLVSTPSYALVIAQALEAAGIDPAGTPLELGLFGGEPWTEGLRVQIDRALGMKAINFYGLSEMCGPGVAAECLAARDGLHVNEDHFLVEVIDPETEMPVPPGTDGELVFTTLTKEALPLIRYRTGDLGALALEPCGCGRTTARLVRLGGRRDDMIIIRGVNLFPSHVEQLLLSVDGVAPRWRLILERTGPMDELTLECEPAHDGIDRGALANYLEGVLKERTGVRIVVSVLEPGGVPRSEGKAVRVVDRR